ncbi:MAG: OmpA family protein [Chitinophagaceae bacterium]
MRKLLLSLLTLGSLGSAYAQVTPLPTAHKKRPTLTVNFIANDFRTAALAKQKSLGSVLNDGSWSRPNQLAYGLGVQYLVGLSDHLDFSSNLQLSFPRYAVPSKPTYGLQDGALTELDANIHLKLLSDKYRLVPYLSAGVGANLYKVYWGAYMPFGAGLQFALDKAAGVYAFSNFQYRIGVSDLAVNHFNYSIGIGGAIGSNKEPKVIPPPPPPPVDTDKDGIIDEQDKCPTVPGVAKYQGCPVPDTDKDGINDEEDKCPTVPGVAKYQGCPVPDTDKDGINDEEDKCPTVPGVAKYQGCPIPDTDGDGVNDEEDKCPNEAGPASNYGCPEKAKQMQAKVDMAAKQIYFATGSSKLLATSFTSLNNVVKLLQENTDLGLDIEGHTDNTGNAANNMKLSQARAEAVKAYIAKKGIDASRLTANGYGDTMPVADNKTNAGKAKNRRVELKLKQL